MNGGTHGKVAYCRCTVAILAQGSVTLAFLFFVVGPLNNIVLQSKILNFCSRGGGGSCFVDNVSCGYIVAIVESGMQMGGAS